MNITDITTKMVNDDIVFIHKNNSILSPAMDMTRTMNMTRVSNNALNIHMNGSGYNMNGSGMDGSGFIDSIKNIAGRVVNVGKVLNSINDTQFGASVKNFVNNKSSSKYKRDGFPGEKHIPLRDRDGHLVMSNYLGPGTQYEKRRSRGDDPINRLDAYAMLHDGQYEQYKGKPKKIREADKQFITNVMSDSRINKIQKSIGVGAIGGKIALEKLGYAPYEQFKGSGMLLPGAQLRKKILSQNRRKKGKKGKKIVHRKKKSMKGDGLLTSLVAGIVVPALISKLRK